MKEKHTVATDVAAGWGDANRVVSAAIESVIESDGVAQTALRETESCYKEAVETASERSSEWVASNKAATAKVRVAVEKANGVEASFDGRVEALLHGRVTEVSARDESSEAIVSLGGGRHSVYVWGQQAAQGICLAPVLRPRWD